MPIQSVVLSVISTSRWANCKVSRPLHRRTWSRRAHRITPATILITSSLNKPKPSRIVPESEKIRPRPAERADAADVGVETLGQKEEADLENVGEDRREQDHAEQRQQYAGETSEDHVPMGEHGVSARRERGDVLQLAAHEAGSEVDQMAAKHHEQQDAGDQEHGRAEVLAERDLALLAGLLPAMRCRVK